jgi:predicted Fe-Mo cluster-binding NifX family protein
MKIAAITDDGKTISQHFGRAPYYLVVSVENGQIMGRELRDKLGHSQFANQAHDPEGPGQVHGMGTASHNKHLQMSEAIADCEALLCGGMGMGAY